MSAFTEELNLTSPDTDCLRWLLGQRFSYEVGHEGSGQVIEVPAGFSTDGASVPRPLRAILPAWARYSRAAVIHDYLYHLLRRGTPHTMSPSRRKADAIFYDAMLVCRTPRPVAVLMWAVVRLFGARAARNVTET